MRNQQRTCIMDSHLSNNLRNNQQMEHFLFLLPYHRGPIFTQMFDMITFTARRPYSTARIIFIFVNSFLWFKMVWLHVWYRMLPYLFIRIDLPPLGFRLLPESFSFFVNSFLLILEFVGLMVWCRMLPHLFRSGLIYRLSALDYCPNHFHFLSTHFFWF